MGGRRADDPTRYRRRAAARRHRRRRAHRVLRHRPAVPPAGPRVRGGHVRSRADAVRAGARRRRARPPEDQGGDGGLRQGRREPAFPLLRRRRARPPRERGRSARPLPHAPLYDRRPDRPAHGDPRGGSRTQPCRDRVRRLVQRPPGLSRPHVRPLAGARGGGRRRQRGGRRRADPLAHARGAGDDRHRGLRAGGAEPSRIREVYVLGRRGPAQAAFTNPEVRELGELAGADITALPDEVELDELTRQALERAPDRATQKKVEILKEYARRAPTGKPRRLVMRFLVSPVELRDDGTGAVGYRGVPLPGVPFNDDWGVILNDKGRVLDPQTKHPLVGQYTAGWIKRGPTGVIGTNKPDAVETVAGMVEDLARDIHLRPAAPSPAAVERLIGERQPQYLSYQDWQRLDEIETRRGKETGKPRVKFTRVKDMLAALGRA